MVLNGEFYQPYGLTCGAVYPLYYIFNYILFLKVSRCSSDPLLLALQLLGPGEHWLRSLPLQANHAEQGKYHRTDEVKLRQVIVSWFISDNAT